MIKKINNSLDLKQKALVEDSYILVVKSKVSAPCAGLLNEIIEYRHDKNINIVDLSDFELDSEIFEKEDDALYTILNYCNYMMNQKLLSCEKKDMRNVSNQLHNVEDFVEYYKYRPIIPFMFHLKNNTISGFDGDFRLSKPQILKYLNDNRG
jgi:hypothetical protein